MPVISDTAIERAVDKLRAAPSESILAQNTFQLFNILTHSCILKRMARASGPLGTGIHAHRLRLHRHPHSQHCHSFRPALPVNVFPHLAELFVVPASSAQDQFVKLQTSRTWSGLVGCPCLGYPYQPPLLPSS